MIELGGGLVSRAARKTLGLDIGDGPGRAADLDDLAGLWQRARRGQRRSSPTCLPGLNPGNRPRKHTVVLGQRGADLRCAAHMDW